MRSRIRLFLLLGACTFLGLGACILVPDGGGHGGGEHEDREHHDHDEEHRHDLGLEQRERLGLNAFGDERGLSAFVVVAVYVPEQGLQRPRARAMWA